MDATLALSFLGSYHVALEGQPTIHFATGKVRALLAFLAAEAPRPLKRSILCTLLWPDMQEQLALRNLTQTLTRLRRSIRDPQAEPPFLLITRDQVQFNPAAHYRLDVSDFTRLTCGNIAELERAADLYRGDFLADFSLPDSAVFEEWAVLKRAELQRLALELFYRLATHHEQGGRYGLAAHYAGRQLAVEPWREEAHQQMMRVLVLDGQRSAALAQYASCRRLLQQELGIQPAAETTALYALIRDGKLSPGSGVQERRMECEEPEAYEGARTPNTGAAGALAFSPDGQWLAAAGSDGVVRLWHGAGWIPAGSLAGQRGGIRALAFGPEGHTLASAGEDQTVKVWDVRTGGLLRAFIGPPQPISALAFSADGTLLAGSGLQGMIEIWDIKTGERRGRLAGENHQPVEVPE